MPKKYFIRQQYACADRNKLDTDMRHFAYGLLDSRVMTAEQLKEAWKQIKDTSKSYNEKYARVSKKLDPHKMDLSAGKESTLLIISDVLHYIAYEVRENLADLALQLDGQIEMVNWMWDNAMQAEEKNYWITPDMEPGVMSNPISSADLCLIYQNEG